MPEVITSPSNPKVKRLLALQQKSSARREAGLFVVEGQRELQHCIDAGFEIDSVFYCPSRCGDAPLQNFASLIPPTAAQRVPPIYEAMGGHGFAGVNPAATTTEVVFWAQNWRKGGLQPRRNEIIREQGFYNQTWCGCEFSRQPTTKNQ